MGGKYLENIWELYIYVISDKTDALRILQQDLCRVTVSLPGIDVGVISY